ncbi:MAG: fumarylacetoacetate hydrolase family protein [Deltaproteobacteria bacterium]|nr:fumarylacetoacetate hydrolase family protein [Deltaproteobacteria bacterium]
MSHEVIWIGRASRPGRARQLYVRVRTDGRAPTPDDVATAIDDPFAAATPALSDEAPGDAAELAASLPDRPEVLRAPIRDLTLRAPLRPGKIICVGRNYAAHAKEMGNEVPTEPLLFSKPATALLPSGAPLSLPRGYERIDMEAELVVVVGRTGHSFDRERALEHVFGYVLGNDVSNRDLQKLDKQWTRAKGFDGFAPLGSFIRVHGGAAPPADARIQGFVDDALRQDAPLSDMIFDIPYVLAYVAACMTLEPGDLIFTGTPEGVSALAPGCVTAVGMTGFELGRLATPVR